MTDLNDKPTPDFTAGDLVCFKDWPDFVYYVEDVCGEGAYMGHGLLLPTAALKKVVLE